MAAAELTHKVLRGMERFGAAKVSCEQIEKGIRLAQCMLGQDIIRGTRGLSVNYTRPILPPKKHVGPVVVTLRSLKLVIDNDDKSLL